jgi:hypothetical protein
MACGDVLSLGDLQTAKKHQIFEAEVITGKTGGVASGAAIDYATNQVTGQTQKTLPAVLRDAGFRPAPFTFATGGTLAVGDSDMAVLWPVSSGGDGQYYLWKGAYPKVVPAASSPATAGGVSASGWLPLGDITLRNDLAASTGSTLLGDSAFGTVAQGLSAVEQRAGAYSQADAPSISKTESTVFKDHGAVATLKDSSDAANGYSVFPSTSPTKRWVTSDKGLPIDIRRFKQTSSGWTEALQKAFDNKEPVLIPVGDFVFDGTAKFTDTPIVEGVNRKLSWLTSSVGLPIMRNKNSDTDTALFGKISNVGLKTADGFTGPIDRGLIDMKSCQFFRIEDVWFFGNGNALSIGAYVEAVLNVTEASYNLFSHIYAGNLRFGLYIGGVANSNRIEYGRFQPPANCAGVYVDPGSTYVDDLTIFASGFEYPGAVSRGVLLNGNPTTKNIHTVNIIGGNRFELLLAGVAGAGVRDLICDERENYFDSCTSNISMVSSSVKPSDFAEALVLSGSLFSSMGVISLSVPSIGVYDFGLDRPHENKVAAFATSDQPETKYELLSTNIVRVKTFASGGIAAAASMLSVSVKKFY